MPESIVYFKRKFIFQIAGKQVRRWTRILKNIQVESSMIKKTKQIKC